MSKQLSFLIFIMTSALIMNAQSAVGSFVVSDKAKSELFGKVKSCTGTIYEATRSNGTVKKTSLFNTSTVDYDKHGFTTRTIMPNQTTKYVNEYDSKGYLKSVKTYIQGQYDGASRYTYNPTQVRETLYDEHGNQIGTVIHSQGKSIINDGEIKTTTFYNSKNLMTKVISEISTPDGIMTITTVPTYNNHLAIEKITLSTHEGTGVIYYSDYKYDQHGNWIYRVKSQDSMGMRVEERRIEYYQ